MPIARKDAVVAVTQWPGRVRAASQGAVRQRPHEADWGDLPLVAERTQKGIPRTASYFDFEAGYDAAGHEAVVWNLAQNRLRVLNQPPE